MISGGACYNESGFPTKTDTEFTTKNNIKNAKLVNVQASAMEWRRESVAGTKTRRCIILGCAAVVILASYLHYCYSNGQFFYKHKALRQPQPKSMSEGGVINSNFELYGDCREQEPANISMTKGDITGHAQVYPDDYVIACNIRSTGLVSIWIDSVLGEIYCDSSAQRVDSRSSRMVIARYDAGNIYVQIVLYDSPNVPRNHGGDVIVVWAERRRAPNNNATARVAGMVVDHLNGTYTAKVTMLWEGTTDIRAKLVAHSGNSCLKQRAIHKYGNSVYAVANPYSTHLGFGKTTNELARCGPTPLLPGYSAICNFTEANRGLGWFCGHPKSKHLNCSDARHFATLPLDKSKIVPKQPNTEVIHTHITNYIPLVLKVEFNSANAQYILNKKLGCKDISPTNSWIAQYPIGYFWEGHWRQTYCVNTVITRQRAMQCLRGKVVRFFGDSTARQYSEDIAALLGLHYVYGHNVNHVEDPSSRLDIRFYKHEMPYYGELWPKQLNSTEHHIRLLADDDTVSGSGLIVSAHYNAHMQAYPVSVYRNRVASTVRAMKYLLSKKPTAKLFFKGPHLIVDKRNLFDARVPLLFRDVVFEEFREIRDSVIYLDTLPISIAHNSTLLHPVGEALRSQTEQMLAFIC